MAVNRRPQNFYTKLLVDSDHVYLSKKYDLDLDFVRGMTDADWCAFLGCTVEELAFYLLEDESFEDYFDEDEQFEGSIFDDERYEDDSMDVLFEDPYLLGNIVDIASRRKPAPVAAPYAVAGFNRTPAPATKPKKKEPVPHHFEIVR
jgi:hypothetical protein